MTDVLDQDPPLRGQNYYCVSFISPEEVINQKELFFFRNFLGFFAKDLSSFFEQTMVYYKDNPQLLAMIKSIHERYNYIFDDASLQSEYDFYKSQNSEALDKEYFEKNKFQTTIRGLKVRGCFDTLEEAKKRAEQIRKFDKLFNVYVAQVGCWCPWSPYPQDIEDFSFANSQLNTLMHKYKEGQDVKDALYKMRKNELLQNAGTSSSDVAGPSNIHLESS